MAQHGGWYSSATEPSEAHQSNPGSRALGVILVLIGILFFAREITGPNFWHWTWPLIIVAAGGLLFALMFAIGRGASGLAIPGSIVTTTGVILLIQNTFGIWQTWAYAWALVVPTAVGVGIWLMGTWGGKPRRQEVGFRMTEIGLLIFLGFAAFFELVLNLSKFWDGTWGPTVIAVILIAIGAYVLTRRSEGTSWR